MGKSEECVNQHWLWALVMPLYHCTGVCVFVRKVSGQPSISRAEYGGEAVSMVYRAGHHEGKSLTSGTQAQPRNGVSFSEGLAQASCSHPHKFLQTIQFYLTFIGLHLTFPSTDLFFFLTTQL